MGCFLWIVLSVCHGGCSLPACDLVEINHVVEADGKEAFCQLLALDWSPQFRRFNCQQWVMVARYTRQGAVTTGETASGNVVAVQSRLFRETWTGHDPERENIKLFAQEYRRKVF